MEQHNVTTRDIYESMDNNGLLSLDNTTDSHLSATENLITLKEEKMLYWKNTIQSWKIVTIN